VCPDFLEQALVEGECQQLQAGDIGPDIIALCANAEAYGKHRSRPTVFDSTGFAVEDHAAMNLLLGYVQELRLGSRVAIEHFPVNPKDPYDFAKPQATESTTRFHAIGR
jgi:ornithine cyclodeaminase/alanine dehydrogenase-like protein (mu-crystallin family)